MHTDKVWIVIVLLIIILVGSNLLMFGIVRGWMPRKGKKDVFHSLGNLANPLKQDDDKMKELSQRVKDLKSDEDE